MKNALFLIMIPLFLTTACKKDEQKESPSLDVQEDNSLLENTLVSGSDCTSFSRLIEGSEMERILSVQQTPDGGYILCGATETIAENEDDILVLKTDCFGETEWMNTISNEYYDIGHDITLLASGDYLISARYNTQPFGSSIYSSRGQLIKLTSSGVVIWTQDYDFGISTSFHKIHETSDGGFVICANDIDIGGFVFKTDASGTEVWRNELGYNTQVYDLEISGNTNYIICGSISNNNQEDILISEVSSLGNTVWSESIDKNDIPNVATSIALLDSDILISGYNRISGVDLPGFVMRLDGTGNEIWYRSLEPESIDQFSNIDITYDGQVFGAGSKSDLLSLIKINPNDGSILWEVENQSSPTISDLQLCDDGGFVLVGNLFISTGNRDGYILKIDSNGY